MAYWELHRNGEKCRKNVEKIREMQINVEKLSEM